MRSAGARRRSAAPVRSAARVMRRVGQVPGVQALTNLVLRELIDVGNHVLVTGHFDAKARKG